MSAGKQSCPICGKPMRPEAKPFCSRRCADIDLGRWLGGVYAIPAGPDDDTAKRPAGLDESSPEEV